MQFRRKFVHFFFSRNAVANRGMFKNETSLTDYYSDERDESIRGVLLYQNIPRLITERISGGDIGVHSQIQKSCERFPLALVAPVKPCDPLYVFSKWMMVCQAENVACLANTLLEGIESMFGAKCAVKTNSTKAKISVDIPTNLSIKIKFFAVSEDPQVFCVMFRKDSGDWFAFSSFFKSCVKYLGCQGIELMVEEQH